MKTRFYCHACERKYKLKATRNHYSGALSAHCPEGHPLDEDDVVPKRRPLRALWRVISWPFRPRSEWCRVKSVHTPGKLNSSSNVIVRAEVEDTGENIEFTMANDLGLEPGDRFLLAQGHSRLLAFLDPRRSEVLRAAWWCAPKPWRWITRPSKIRALEEKASVAEEWKACLREVTREIGKGAMRGAIENAVKGIKDNRPQGYMIPSTLLDDWAKRIKDDPEGVTREANEFKRSMDEDERASIVLPVNSAREATPLQFSDDEEIRIGRNSGNPPRAYDPATDRHWEWDGEKWIEIKPEKPGRLPNMGDTAHLRADFARVIQKQAREGVESARRSGVECGEVNNIRIDGIPIEKILRDKPSPWAPKVGEWAMTSSTKSRFFPPGPGPIKVERIVDDQFVELDGVLFGFGCFRPLRLSEVETKEQAEQFMGRKGKYRNSTGELPGHFEIVGFVESRKGSNPWKLHWHDHGLGIADPIGCSGVSEDMTLFAEEE